MKITVYYMINELSTWVKFSPEDKARAKASPITNKNNSKFRKLVNDYSNGIYDEDLEVLAAEIKWLL